MLYLESPINVGFSFNATTLPEKDLYNDDAATDAKYNALVSFFKKYPHLKKNKFYITGKRQLVIIVNNSTSSCYNFSRRKLWRSVYPTADA